MTASREAVGLQYLLVGMVLQLVIALLAPGMRYADYVSMGISVPPFELSQLAVPAAGMAIGALYLAGFRFNFLDRPATRWVRLARWPLIAATISVAGTFAIAFRLRFEPNPSPLEYSSWPARAAFDIGLGAFAGLTFLLMFFDVAKARGRAIASLAMVLGAAGGGLRYAPYLSQFDLSIYSWVLGTLSLALFLLQAVQFWREASGMVPSAAGAIAPPPSP